jgi:hypothetical protein
MLQNSLTDNEKVLIKYEKISITTIKGNNAIGTPFGIKNFKKYNPLKMNPKINSPTFTENATIKVIAN